MMLAGLVTSALLLTPAAASASSTRTCRSDNGTNVNAYFGIPRADAIWLNLQGQRPPCLTVVRGNPLVRTHGWIAQLPPGTIVDGERIQTVYPEGYEPDHPAPMRDFLSKLTQARYVISRDGTVELTRTVTGRELFAHAKLGRFGDLFVAPDDSLTPGVTIHGAAPEWTTLEPFSSRSLAVGQHTIEIYWTLRERHCDGFAADPANNCLPAGESLTTSTVFDVVRRR
jgi:hypothetical protein